MHLCVSWASVSADPAIGRDQNRDQMWHRICEVLLENSVENIRNEIALMNRWNILNRGNWLLY
jgi:hypothetical protein